MDFCFLNMLKKETNNAFSSSISLVNKTSCIVKKCTVHKKLCGLLLITYTHAHPSVCPLISTVTIFPSYVEV